MGKFLSLASEQMETGFVTMERSVGVAVDEGVSDGSAEYERQRKAQDESRGKEVHRWLTQYNVLCPLGNFLSLVRPDFEEPNGYWASIGDLLRFFQNIGSRTLMVPGTGLAEIFDHTATIVSWPGLSDPSYDQVFRQIVDDGFRKAKQAIIPMFDVYIASPITAMTIDQLTHFDHPNFTSTRTTTVIDRFRAKCEQIYPRSATTFSQIYEQGIRDEAGTIVIEVYFERCFTVVFPSEIDTIAASLGAQARSTLANLTYPQFAAFGQAQLRSTLQDATESRLKESSTRWNPGLLKDARFPRKVGQLRERVQVLVFQIRQSPSHLTMDETTQDRRRAKFAVMEDIQLRQLVAEFGVDNWHHIASRMPGRHSTH
jgi:hypothetical protein